MGFIRRNTLPILKEHRLRPFSGHCLCLGQVDVYFTYENLQRMANIGRVHLNPDIPVTLSYRPDLAAKEYISRETLFGSIGFKQVSAVDYSDFEDAEYIFDLNSPDLPDILLGQFDVVINHGTMEHVFHIPNCLTNIYRMLKVGGRVIHSSPSSNYIDHGFYMFSPTFFHDYYIANKWTIHTLQISHGDPQYQEIEAPFYADYEPGILDHLSSGGLGSGAYGTICIAEKTEQSASTVIPQQGFYERLGDWKKKVPKGVLEEILLGPPFEHEIGYCWQKDLRRYEIARGDGKGTPRGSSLMLWENDVIQRPPHALHETIRTYGKGCYSHWGDMLYFSTSDNTNPNTNGRKYRIKAIKQQ